MTELFPSPQVFELPLSKGRDLYCEFVYEPLVVDVDGNPVLLNGQPQYVAADYPAGATVTLTIDADTPVSGSAVITGDTAVVLIDHTEVDAIPAGTGTPAKGKLWRLGITYTSGVDDVLANGKTIRKDGAA